MSNTGGDQLNLAQEYFVRNQQRLSATRRKYPNMDIEDLWQMVFLKLRMVPDPYWKDEVKEPDHFIQKTYSNCLIDTLNKAAKEREKLNGFAQKSTNEIKTGQNPADAYLPGILVRELLSMGSAEEKQLLKLLFEGANRKQIASVMNLSEAAARKRIERLYKKLRILIKGEGGAEDPP